MSTRKKKSNGEYWVAGYLAELSSNSGEVFACSSEDHARERVEEMSEFGEDEEYFIGRVTVVQTASTGGLRWKDVEP